MSDPVEALHHEDRAWLRAHGWPPRKPVPAANRAIPWWFWFVACQHLAATCHAAITPGIDVLDASRIFAQMVLSLVVVLVSKLVARRRRR